MKILIDTDQKTIKLEEGVEFKKLAKFVKDNKLEDFTVLPGVITVREKEWYPVWPTYPVEPVLPYPMNPWGWPTITCGSTGKPNGGTSTYQDNVPYTLTNSNKVMLEI